MPRIIVKRRLVGDYRKWEDIPVYKYEGNLQMKTASTRFKHHARQTNVFEIRWNYEGSQQGYYISGPQSAREKHIKRGKQ